MHDEVPIAPHPRNAVFHGVFFLLNAADVIELVKQCRLIPYLIPHAFADDLQIYGLNGRQQTMYPQNLSTW